jgi:hypothetical protein
MQEGRNDQLGILTLRRVCDEAGYFEQVVNVRFLGGAFSSLVNVPSRRGVRSPQYGNPS